MQWDAEPALCDSYEYGETEDYLVNIVGGTSNPANNTLEVALAGTGSGNVTSSPSGIDIDTGVSSFDYESGESVTLAAVPDDGSSFSACSGDCSGTNSSTSVTIDADKTCTATFLVGKSDQTITFGALASKNYGDAPFDLTATASSALAVTYASSDTTVATISGSTVTIVGAGSTTVTASQTGNDDYNAAADVTQTLTISVALPAITTGSVTSITLTGALCGANITDDGGTLITSSGVCWGQSADPTQSNACTSDGGTGGAFESILTGSTPGSTYYVRAYAANTAGTALRCRHCFYNGNSDGCRNAWRG